LKYPFLFAGGDWGLAALIQPSLIQISYGAASWRAAKKENPNNPVNPV
jgi:hypothetical protein